MHAGGHRGPGGVGGHRRHPPGTRVNVPALESNNLGWFACFRIQFLTDHIMIHSCLVCVCVYVCVCKTALHPEFATTDLGI